MKIVMAIFSCTANFRIRSVFSITPSAASTNRTIPSHIRRPAAISSEKFTWPGVSKTFIR